MSRKRPHKGNTRRGRPSGPRQKSQGLLTGIIEVYRPGSARVSTPEGSFQVARGGIREAMSGDEVQVSLVRRGGSENKAVVRSVLQRNTHAYLGIYERLDPLGVVRPLDARLTHDFFVLPQDTSAMRLDVAEGDVVEARILDYPQRGVSGVVTIERKVGAGRDLDLGIESVIASHGLATEFGPAALAEAEALELDVEGTLGREPERCDLRELVVLTIDPQDARDFDDAVSARRLERGFEVGVHIADVTSYLAWDSSLDLEARARTCSTYLADRVLPMLPERLCNDLCSLRPNEDRLSMSVTLTLDAGGTVLDAQACSSVVRSRARLSYEQADELLEGRLAPSELPCDVRDADAVAETIRVLDEVAMLRGMLRERRGAIDFATREAKVVLDENGVPQGVKVRTRTRATSLIEEAMLMANEAVASQLAADDLPSAYRVHERPSPEHLLQAVPLLRELELIEAGEVDPLVAGNPFVVQRVLGRAQGTRLEQVVDATLLRAQKRAIYLPHNEGHYALGARAYCHFTSPIRRYPDVVVHRTLKALLAGTTDSREQRKVATLLPQLLRSCSERERVADAAARDSQKVKMAELFSTHVGERFAGVVSGCTHSGLFVTLDDTCAEGLLPMRALGEEWFVFDEARMSLTGSESGRSYRPGTRVVVEVASTNPSRGEIDFNLAEGGTGCRGSDV